MAISPSLKQYNFTPATMTFGQYTPIKPNTSILFNAMDKQVAAEEKKTASRAALDNTLSVIEKNLDASEIDWFNEYKDNLEKQIEEQSDAGNTTLAANKAIQLAGSVLSDSELINRQKANEKHKEFIKSIDARSDLEDLTKERFKELNQYYYDGSADWKAKMDPTKDYSLSTLQLLAEQMTAEEAGGRSSSGTNDILLDAEGKEITFKKLLDAKGKETKDYTDVLRGRLVLGTSSGGSSRQFKSKTAAAMEATFKKLMDDGAVRGALLQRFQNELWAYKNRLEKANDPTLTPEEKQNLLNQAIQYKANISDENGIFIDDAKGFEQWVKTKAIPMFKQMEYDNITTVSEGGMRYTFAPIGGSEGVDTSTFTEDLDELMGKASDAITHDSNAVYGLSVPKILSTTTGTSNPSMFAKPKTNEPG